MGQATPARARTLLGNQGFTILRQINPSGRATSENCPLTTSRLVEYLLGTAAARAAEELDRTAELQGTSDTEFSVANLRNLREVRQRLANDGQFAVVQADSSDRHHVFVMIRIDGFIYAADAQVCQLFMEGPELTAYLVRWQRFKWFLGPSYRVWQALPR